MVGSVSGLSLPHRLKVRALAKKAALLGVAHEREIHYTQSAARWQGISENRKAYKGQYPTEADCSSYTTWCLWNGLSHYGTRDTVNATDWTGGFTGTQKQHGKRVQRRVNWRVGDLVHYGFNATGEHVAIIVDPVRGLVVSHGSEAGPRVIRYDYRPDVCEVRRYV